LDWLCTKSLLISVSWEARITGMSHQHLVGVFFVFFFFSHLNSFKAYSSVVLSIFTFNRSLELFHLATLKLYPFMLIRLFITVANTWDSLKEGRFISVHGFRSFSSWSAGSMFLGL
jgi:hypothetical protein